jgi:hypothetical protein
MKFIKVKGAQCNSQGTTIAGASTPELYIHADLISIIKGSEVYFKGGGHMLSIGESYFTKITLVGTLEEQMK